jgi:hypothetical protein
MDKKEREDQENKKQNFWVDKLKQNASGKIRDLRDSLQGKLRDLTLEELAQLTQTIGTELNHLFISLAAIAADLLRRMQEKNSAFEGRAQAGAIVKVGKFSPTMSREEVEAKLKGLKDFIDESDAPNETKSLTFSMLESQSSKMVGDFRRLRRDVEDFDQQLKQIRGE